jgi:hypothetical protein|eukprot:2934929-Prymnesium_polylepis.1
MTCDGRESGNRNQCIPLHATKHNVMRLQRRNLWVAQHGVCDQLITPIVRRRAANNRKSQLHLIECPFINRGFWEPLSQHILSLGLQAENTPTYWITGTFVDGKQTDSESWALITWAWRSLYACTTKTHLEGARLNFKVALMLTSRLYLHDFMKSGLGGL